MTLTDFYLGGFAHPTTEETTVSTAIYKLTCTHHGHSVTVGVLATSEHVMAGHAESKQEALDFDATFTAIQRVMDKAYTDPMWAKGAIKLARPDGTVIHEMEAK